MPPRVTSTVIRWAGAVAGVLFVGFGAGSCVQGEWGQGLPLLVVGIALLSLPLERRRVLAPLQAAQQWSPQRVSEALAAVGAVRRRGSGGARRAGGRGGAVRVARSVGIRG